MKAIILAAGYATRMYPLTRDRAKALLPLGGRPIVDYMVGQLNGLPGLDEIVVVSNHRFIGQFEEWAKAVKSDVPVVVLDDGSVDESDRLGAIGDIDFALRTKKIDEDVVVVAGDNYITYPLLEQYMFFKEKQADTLCALKIDEPEQLRQFAVAELDKNGKVLSLVEKPDKPASNTAIFAVYFYRSETAKLIQQYLKEGNNPDQPGRFPQWLHTRKDIYAYVMNGECYDIGTLEAYEKIQGIV